MIFSFQCLFKCWGLRSRYCCLPHRMLTTIIVIPGACTRVPVLFFSIHLLMYMVAHAELASVNWWLCVSWAKDQSLCTLSTHASRSGIPTWAIRAVFVRHCTLSYTMFTLPPRTISWAFINLVTSSISMFCSQLVGWSITWPDLSILQKKWRWESLYSGNEQTAYLWRRCFPNYRITSRELPGPTHICGAPLY